MRAKYDSRDERDRIIEDLQMQVDFLEKSRAHWERLSDAADDGMDLMQGEIQELREALKNILTAFDRRELNSETLHVARSLIKEPRAGQKEG